MLIRKRFFIIFMIIILAGVGLIVDILHFWERREELNRLTESLALSQKKIVTEVEFNPNNRVSDLQFFLDQIKRQHAVVISLKCLNSNVTNYHLEAIIDPMTFSYLFLGKFNVKIVKIYVETYKSHLIRMKLDFIIKKAPKHLANFFAKTNVQLNFCSNAPKFIYSNDPHDSNFSSVKIM